MNKLLLSATLVAAYFFLGSATVQAQVVRYNANSYRPALVRPLPQPIVSLRVATPVYTNNLYASVYGTADYYPYRNYSYPSVVPYSNFTYPTYYPSVYPSVYPTYNPYVYPSYYPGATYPYTSGYFPY